jgi:transposase
VSEKSVYQWRRAWEAGGREALCSKGPPGYDCRLGPRLQAELAAWLEEGPASHGWTDDQVWTAARVRTLIGRKFHILLQRLRCHPAAAPDGLQRADARPARRRT